METSDSECFESADEDFEYEKKSTEATTKTDKVKLSSNLETVSDVRNKIEGVTLKTLKIDEIDTVPASSSVITAERNVAEEKKERMQKRQQREQRTKKESKPKFGTKLGQKIEIKQATHESDTPSDREDCWEPGVNYVEEDVTTKSESSEKHISSENYTLQTNVSNTDVSLNKQKPFVEREECWEPGMDYMDSDEDQNNSNKNSPLMKENWEQEIDYIEIDPVNKENVVSKRSTNKENVIEQSKSEEIEEENMWGADDDWETVPSIKTSIENKSVTAEKPSTGGWGSWGNWGGVSTILSTATQGVSTLTNHVSQSISTVLESGIGVPDPEELARIHRNENSNTEMEEDPEPTIQTVFGLGNLVSGVTHITKLVETTSNKVLTGGLDTLEVIGKKTMEVLQEGDPGLKKKRAFLKIKQNKPVLSQILREAKEKKEEENKLLEERHFQKKANYETLFDDNQGLVHLEALEMLSKQCDMKLESITSTYDAEQLKEMQETMSQIKELCEIPEDDEEEQLTNAEIKEKLESAVTDLNVPINYERLHSLWEEAEAWLLVLNLNLCNERELHQQAIETLAHLTALAVEQFHKAGELLLIKEHRSTADEADSLVQLTTTLTSLISIAAAKFSEKLNIMASKAENPKVANELITTVFLEAANSCTYIKDAFQLLIPVLQVGAL